MFSFVHKLFVHLESFKVDKLDTYIRTHARTHTHTYTHTHTHTYARTHTQSGTHAHTYVTHGADISARRVIDEIFGFSLGKEKLSDVR